ncbi:hypothetical protein ANO11243_044400 [Dothideomycetidae sp. 11243]|nr:hypothetical protein ANO11243_044400 [fungal sp. No.11243]
MPPHPQIHLIRHGEAEHNVQRGYPHRDPLLTPSGAAAAAAHINLPSTPDVLIVSPMTRAIQTAMIAFPDMFASEGRVQVWPELREAHDAECNKGVGRVEL